MIAAIDTPDALVDRLVASGFERPVEVRKATLEDVFIQLTGHEFADETAQQAGPARGRRGR